MIAEAEQSLTAVLDYYDGAREAVVAAGYQEEIDWQRGVSLEKVTEQDFLREHAFVVCNSGMRAAVIAKLWTRMRIAFLDFESGAKMLERPETVRAAALEVLNSPPKIDAIMRAAKRCVLDRWELVYREIDIGGVEYLGTWPYMGPVLRWHLAKNLGLDVAKPDRHLVRVAARHGWTDVQAFCRAISKGCGDRVPVVDLVIWRYESTVLDSVSDADVP